MSEQFPAMNFWPVLGRSASKICAEGSRMRSMMGTTPLHPSAIREAHVERRHTFVTLRFASVTVATSFNHSFPSLICVPTYRYDPVWIRVAVSLKSVVLSCVLGT